MKVVEVEWLDAHSGMNECHADKAKNNKPILTRSIGYLIAQNDDGLTLVSDRWPDDPGKGFVEHFIGWGMITQWWKYK